MFPTSLTPYCTALLLGALMLVSACGEEASGPATPTPMQPDTEPEPEVQQKAIYLSPTDHLVRASMAIRGLRPSVDDLDAVHADPDALPGIVDAYLEEASFGASVRDMHNESLLLRPFFFWFPPLGEEMEEMTLVELNRDVQDAPLRLVEHVVMNDLPYSEVVTADYTMANGPVARVWGLDYDGDGDEWVQTRWPEQGRAHAGLLTDSLVHLRHYSTPLNAQRSRANMVSKNFLCFDFLDNDIDVDGNLDLTDAEALKGTVKRPECASCHQALDPLASLFWNFEFFTQPASLSSYPYTHYNPEISNYRRFFTDRAPGYFGQPVQNLAELGQAMAADPRFSTCATKRFYSWLHQVDLESISPQEINPLHEVFVREGMNAKALVKAIVLSDSFRFSHSLDPEAPPGVARLQKVRPRQFSRMMQDLVGFRWSANFAFALDFISPTANFGDVDLMAESLLGYEVLAGGNDDFVVKRPVHTFNPTSSLVFDNFAHEAAGYVVRRDLGDGSPRADKLILVGAQERGEDVLRAEFARLHKKLFAEFVSPDAPEVDQTYELFRAALEMSDDTERAWMVVLTAMLQDSRLLYY